MEKQGNFNIIYTKQSSPSSIDTFNKKYALWVILTGIIFFGISIIIYLDRVKDTANPPGTYIIGTIGLIFIIGGLILIIKNK